MSGALSTALSVGLTAFEIGNALLIRRPRAISGDFGIIIPDCVVEETGRDDVTITDHPVEIGSVISDHAYRKPREITLRWSWTNSGYYDTRDQDVYQQLLALQGPSPSLIEITTGKTLYVNMVVTSLGVTTNSATENALQCVMVCREVIIVSTQTTQIAPASAQASPQSTAPVAQRGGVQLQAKPATFSDTLQTGNVLTRVNA